MASGQVGIADDHLPPVETCLVQCGETGTEVRRRHHLRIVADIDIGKLVEAQQFLPRRQAEDLAASVEIPSPRSHSERPKGASSVRAPESTPARNAVGCRSAGSSAKTVLTEDGEVEISVPGDRAGSFEPQLIAEGQTHFDGFDDKILSLYARGMTVREIQGHLLDLYGTEVSPDLISRVR
jgi:hypothetical protein